MRRPTLNIETLPVGVSFGNKSKINIDRKHFSDIDFAEKTIEEFYLDQCFLEKVFFNQTKIGEGKIIDSIFEKCSFAGIEFNQLIMKRVEIKNSWVQGMQAPGAFVYETYFKSSKLGTANFRYSKLKDVLFESCDLSDTDFIGAELENVTFKNSNLTNAQFSQAKLNQINIKGSEIKNIHISKENLNSLTADTAQALYLVQLFGIKIED